MNKKLPCSNKFLAGTVFNNIIGYKPKKLIAKYKEITIRYPSRLESMSLDPSKIAEYFSDNIYPAGQINFCVDICNVVTIKINNNEKINITDSSNRKSLILHSALLMKKVLKFSQGLDIDIKNDVELKHCGLGSSSSIINSVATAINELFGKPIKSLDLIHYLVSNHGEEIDGSDNYLIQVQSVGGSGICGHFEGGLIVNSGKATPIFQKKLPTDLRIVIGIPDSFTHPDSDDLMNKEIKNMDGFRNTGDKYAKEIAYRLVHESLPGLIVNNFKPCKDLIFDYRWDMGSIKNCSFVCPEINNIAEKLRPLKDDKDVEFLSLSSVGPGFFAITNKPKKLETLFSNLNMRTYTAKIYNGKYKILNKNI